MEYRDSEMLYTFQDFEASGKTPTFVKAAIDNHVAGRMCRTAHTADLYDCKLNPTIHEYVRTIFTLTGMPIEDFTASNNKIASGFFGRLNTQRCTYLLGNGVTFVSGDSTKKKLGSNFDRQIFEAGRKALIHGVSFVFWNLDRIHVFPLTEFVPLWDEETGAMRAGIRFWRLAHNKPVTAVLYEEDGYTKLRSKGDGDDTLHVVEDKRAYKQRVVYTPADGEAVVGEENYGALPIVPMWGSRYHQSTLVGMQEAIDSYDLIRSGFANDLTDVSQIYWIVENAGGMDDKDLAKFRDRLKITHIATANTEDGGKVTPYAQDIPYQARKQYLDDIRAGIYEDFGALDVHTVAAGATNDHIDAAYQPMDEEADDFEFQVSDCIKQILALIGIEDEPIYKRNRISNQYEQVQMLMLEAPYFDDETIIAKMPNVTPDEVVEIMRRKDEEDQARIQMVSDSEEDEDGEGQQDESNQQAPEA